MPSSTSRALIRISRDPDGTRLSIPSAGLRGIARGLLVTTIAATVVLAGALIFALVELVFNGRPAPCAAPVVVLVGAIDTLLWIRTITAARSSGSVRVSASSITIVQRRWRRRIRTRPLSLLVDVFAAVEEEQEHGIVFRFADGRHVVVFAGTRDRELRELAAQIRDEWLGWQRVVTGVPQRAYSRRIVDLPPITPLSAGSSFAKVFLRCGAFCVLLAGLFDFAAYNSGVRGWLFALACLGSLGPAALNGGLSWLIVRAVRRQKLGRVAIDTRPDELVLAYDDQVHTVSKQSISRIALEHTREFPLSFLDGMDEVVITFASGGRWRAGFGRRAEVLAGVVESVKAELAQTPSADQPGSCPA